MQQQHQSVLGYKNARYFKLALVLSGASIAAYAWHEPPTVYLKPYGGTWLGYTLGTIAAVLIVWLMLLGVRKRRYGRSVGTVQGWTSAHIYLGASLIIIASLHCAFEFGWNIHTLAYALMMLVIASGFYGLYVYLRYPELIAKNLSGDTFEAMLLSLADLDRRCRRVALDLPDEINAIVAGASRATARDLGGVGRLGLRATAAGDHPVARACLQLRELGKTLRGTEARLHQQLLADMTRKRVLTERVRRDLRLRSLLQAWLYLHVPLSFALLAALIGHIVSVFYFW